MVDLTQGRRTEFLRCEFWSVDDEDFIPPNQICHERIPSGTFRATESNPYSDKNQIVGTSFMTKQSTVVLETKDNLITPVRLRENDIVRFDDVIYRVESVQRNPIKKRRQFGKR